MTRALLVLLVLGLVGLLVAAELGRPREPDRRLHARPDGQEPFDAEAFLRLAPAWLGARVDTAAAPLGARLGGAGAGAAAFFVTDAFDPDSAETAALVAFVERGGTAVVAAHALGPHVGRALGTPGPTPEKDLAAAVADETGFRLAPEDVSADDLYAYDGATRLEAARGGQAFDLPVDLGGFALDGLDPARTDTLAVLAGTDIDGAGLPVAVRVRLGAGRVLLLSAPLAFSNAALAQDGDGPALLGLVLAAVPPVGRVLWDTRFAPRGAPAGGLLRVARRSPALGWAVALFALLGALLVTVGARRMQRPIPVVRPPPNAQTEFARTVGALHEATGDTGWLARRRARLTVDLVRTRLGLPDAALDEPTARAAARRAGLDEAETVALFQRLRHLRADPAPDAARVLAADRDAFAFARAVRGGAVASSPREVRGGQWPVAEPMMPRSAESAAPRPSPIHAPTLPPASPLPSGERDRVRGPRATDPPR